MQVLEPAPPIVQACGHSYPFALPGIDDAARAALAAMVCGECDARRRRAAALSALEAARAAGWPELTASSDAALEYAALLRRTMVEEIVSHCDRVARYAEQYRTAAHAGFERRRAEVVVAALLRQASAQWWARYAAYPLAHVVQAALSACDRAVLRSAAENAGVAVESQPDDDGRGAPWV